MLLRRIGVMFCAVLMTVTCVATSSATAVGEPLSGVVTDSAALPLEGVVVNLSSGGGSMTVLTAADGSYSFVAPDGQYQLQFSKPGFVTEVYDELIVRAGSSTPVGTPVNLSSATPTVINESLRRVPRLRGIARDTAGNAAAVTVSASPASFGPSASAPAGLDGFFEIELPVPGTYRVSGFGGGFLFTYAPSTTSQFAGGSWFVADDGVVDLGVLTMLRGGSLSGTVSNAAGPLGGVSVSANPNPPTVQAFGSAISAADGSYTINGLPEANYQVNFSAPGYLSEGYNDHPASGPFDLVHVAEGQPTININAVLAAGATVQGVVLDPLGLPLGGANVQVIRQGGVGFGVGTSTISNPDGTYSIGGLSSGSYVVLATKAGLSAAFASGGAAPDPLTEVIGLVAETTTTVNFQLRELGSLVGQVLQPDGQPLAGVSVSILAGSVSSVAWFPAYVAQFMASTTTDVNGEFVFHGLAPTSFRVTVSPTQSDPLAFEYYNDAYTEAAASLVPVPAGGTASPIQVKLEVGGVISGRVTDPTGQPVVGTMVMATGPNGEYGGSVSTDANGVYRIQGMPPGVYHLLANQVGDLVSTYHPGVADIAQAPSVSVALGQVVTGIDIQMVKPAAARMEATVLDANGVPFPTTTGFWGVGFCVAPGVPVATFSQCAGGALTGPLNATKPAAGQFVGTGIVPGTYNVAAFFAFPIAISAPVNLTLGADDVAICTFRINGPGTCTVHHDSPPPPDPDSDGIPAAVETAVNTTGDGNGDGTADSQQDNVTSLPSPVSGGGYVTVATPGTTTLSSVTVVDPASVAATAPPGATLEAGVAAYTVNGITPASTVDIDIFFTVPTAANGYAKLQGGQWVPLPSAAFTKVSPTHFTLHLTDGGIGDEDGQANGVIVDPGVPVVLDLTAPTVVCPTTPTVMINTPGASLTAAVTDTASGVVSPVVTVALDVTSLGSFVVPVTATDRAGNSRTVPCAYRVGVAFGGFRAPIENNRITEAKAGQTLAVRWKTLDALGKPVLSPSFVSIRTVAISCPTKTKPSIEIGTSQVDTTSTATSLGKGKWKYLLRTASSATGCLRVYLDLQGVTTFADIQFKGKVSQGHENDGVNDHDSDDD